MSWFACRLTKGAGQQAGNAVVKDFRTDCLHELKKIKEAWLGLNYALVQGALIVEPAGPSIPVLTQ